MNTENVAILKLRALLQECKDDENYRNHVAVVIITELEAVIPLVEILQALRGVLEYKYVLDDKDKELLTRIILKVLKMKEQHK